MKEPKNQPGGHSKLIQFRKPSDHPSVKKRRRKKKRRERERERERERREKRNKMRRPA